MKKVVSLMVLLSLGVASAAWAETREDVQNRLDMRRGAASDYGRAG